MTATARAASSPRSARSPGVRLKSWGKAGALAKYVHRAADVHAARNQSLTKAGGAPRTEVELAKALREQASQARDYMREAMWDAVRAGSTRRIDMADALGRELDEIVREYEKVLRTTAAEAVRAAYGGGKAYAMDVLGVTPEDWGKGDNPFAVSFSRPDRAAMAALANDLFTDLAGQTENMARSAVAVLRTVAGEVLQQQLARGQNVRDAARELEKALVAQGYSPAQAVKDLAARLGRNPQNAARAVLPVTPGDAAVVLADDGLLKFIDKAGRAWDLRDYTEMAAKTKLFIARNEAAVATMAGAEVYHWRANTTSEECDLCDAQEGEIFWTGEGPAQGYSVCPLGLPPWHPNCEHYVTPEVLVART